MQNQRHLLCHLGRELAHLGQPLDRLHPKAFIQVHQQRCAAFGVEMRQHQSDGLRMFALQKLAELMRVHLLQHGQIAGGSCARIAYLRQQLIGACGSEGLGQQLRRKVVTTADHVSLRANKPLKLVHNLLKLLIAHLAHARDLVGNRLHVGLAKTLEQIGR